MIYKLYVNLSMSSFIINLTKISVSIFLFIFAYHYYSIGTTQMLDKQKIKFNSIGTSNIIDELNSKNIKKDTNNLTEEKKDVHEDKKITSPTIIENEPKSYFEPKIVEIIVKKNQTFSSILKKQEIENGITQDIINKVSKIYNLKKLPIGQKIIFNYKN